MADRRRASFGTALKGFAELLSATPDPVLSRSRVLPRRPAASADVPMITMLLRLAEPVHRGLGRIADGERPNPVPGEPPLGARWTRQLGGRSALEVWAESRDELENLVRRLDDRMAEESTPRSLGFLKLEPAALEPAEYEERQAAAGSSFGVWRQRLEYRFHFEAPPVPEASDGIIDRIDVMMSHDPQPGPEDNLVIPSEPVTHGG